MGRGSEEEDDCDVDVDVVEVSVSVAAPFEVNRSSWLIGVKDPVVVLLLLESCDSDARILLSAANRASAAAYARARRICSSNDPP